MGRGQKARRPADTRADIQNRYVSGDPGQFGEVGGRGEPTGVKLVEGAQLPGSEPLILRPENHERRLQAFSQSNRAIVVAHAIKVIGHCKVPPADRRINWRSDSACSRIEPGTTKAGVSTLGIPSRPIPGPYRTISWDGPGVR